jgi:hypothetical protein
VCGFLHTVYVSLLCGSFRQDFEVVHIWSLDGMSKKGAVQVQALQQPVLKYDRSRLGSGNIIQGSTVDGSTPNNQCYRHSTLVLKHITSSLYSCNCGKPSMPHTGQTQLAKTLRCGMCINCTTPSTICPFQQTSGGKSSQLPLVWTSSCQAQSQCRHNKLFRLSQDHRSCR